MNEQEWLDFIDSGTLYDMLLEKELPPASACILTAQSKKKSLQEKLRLLAEYRSSFSPDDFRRTIPGQVRWNLRESPDFYEALGTYIEKMQSLLALADSSGPDIVFSVTDYGAEGALFRTFAEARESLRQYGEGGETILMREIGSESPPLGFFLNESFEISRILLYEDGDWNIEEGFTELPCEYVPGDIVMYGESDYAVVTHTADANRPFSPYTDYTDMSLYCLEFCPDKTHSCSGAFCHVHVPILEAERIQPAALPERFAPLAALSLLMRGEIRTDVFLEAYSNRSLTDFLQYICGKEWPMN